MNNKSLIEGSIGRGILFFMLPLVASSLIQQLYSTIDLIIVGQYLGTEASASIGASNLIVTCLVGFFNGLSVGSGVVTSHAYGKGDSEKLKKIINTSFITSIIGGFILMIIGIVFAPTFLKMMNTPDGILMLSTKYLRIYMMSIISIVIYNLCSGVIRSLGDSKTPMMLQIYGGIINVIADIVFIIILKMGVEGAAIATFLSQTFVAIYIVIYLIKLDLSIALNLKNIKLSNKVMKEILRIGIPAGIQSIAITLSNIIIQSNINSFGVDSIAAFTAYFKIELILYIPIIALGQSVIVFIGQNIGANQKERANKGLKHCILWAALAIFISSFILILSSDLLFSVFSKDREVISLGIQIVRITFPFYFLYVILECLGSAIRAKGKALPPMIIILFSFCFVRIVILMCLLEKMRNLKSIAITYPISWAIASLLMSVYYYRLIKKDF